MTELLHFHFSLSCIEEGKGNALQYSCLENPRDSGAAVWWAAVYGTAMQTKMAEIPYCTRETLRGATATETAWKFIVQFCI